MARAPSLWTRSFIVVSHSFGLINYKAHDYLTILAICHNTIKVSDLVQLYQEKISGGTTSSTSSSSSKTTTTTTSSQVIRDLTKCQIRQFSLGQDILVTDSVGNMGFDEVTDWRLGILLSLRR